MFKEALSDTNLCRDEVFVDPTNWLHRKDVVDLFHLAYLTEDDYNLVVQNEIGKGIIYRPSYLHYLLPLIL